MGDDVTLRGGAVAMHDGAYGGGPHPGQGEDGVQVQEDAHDESYVDDGSSGDYDDDDDDDAGGGDGDGEFPFRESSVRLKDKVRLEFALSPELPYRLLLHGHDPLSGALVDTCVRSPAAWLALQAHASGKRHVVYSLCRDIVASCKTWAVRGPGAVTAVRGLLDLMYDALFMTRGAWYPADGDFPDALLADLDETYPEDTFVLHDFDAAFTLGRKGNYRATVTFDLGVRERALGENHTAMRGSKRSRVPVPDVLAAVFPESAALLQHARPSANDVATAATVVDFLLSRAQSGVCKAVVSSSSPPMPPCSSSPSSSPSSPPSRPQGQKRRASGGAAKRARPSRSARAPADAWETRVLARDRLRAPGGHVPPLYTAVAQIEDPDRDREEDDGGIVLPTEMWQLGYCALNGQVVVDDAPTFERARSLHLGGILLNVPAQDKARTVARLVSARVPAERIAERTAERDAAARVPAHSPASEAVPAAPAEPAAPSTHAAPAAPAAPAAIASVWEMLAAPGADIGVEALSRADQWRLLESLANEFLSHRGGSLKRNLPLMVQCNATILVCHPGSRGAWTSALRAVRGLAVVALEKGTCPTEEQLQSYRTVLVATYTHCASQRGTDPSASNFAPLTRTYYRAIFDDAHLLHAQSSSAKDCVPFHIRATVRWSLGTFDDADPATVPATLASTFNAYADAVVLTAQSLRTYWAQIRPALARVALVYPQQAVGAASSAQAAPPAAPAVLGRFGVEAVRARLTACGVAQYRAAHLACDLCISKTGEKHLVAATPDEYVALRERALQTAVQRVAKKRKLLSETRHPLRGLRCTLVAPSAAFGTPDCCICFDPVRLNRAVCLTRCSHYLCTDCQTECAERQLTACPMCRTPNPKSARRLAVSTDFDATSMWVRNTTKADVLASMHAASSGQPGRPGRGPLVVVCRSTVTAAFLCAMMRLRQIPVLDFGRVRTPAQADRVRTFASGVLLVSSRLVRHTLVLCNTVAAVVFYEPCMASQQRAPYTTAWSCEATAPKKVLYTAGTLEETVVRYGRDAALLKQTPKVTMALAPSPISL
jgi:hypothetical protein